MFIDVLQNIHTCQDTPMSHPKGLWNGSLDSEEIMMPLDKQFRFEIPNNEAYKINYIKLALDHIASQNEANITLD